AARTRRRPARLRAMTTAAQAPSPTLSFSPTPGAQGVFGDFGRPAGGEWGARGAGLVGDVCCHVGCKLGGKWGCGAGFLYQVQQTGRPGGVAAGDRIPAEDATRRPFLSIIDNQSCRKASTA